MEIVLYQPVLPQPEPVKVFEFRPWIMPDITIQQCFQVLAIQKGAGNGAVQWNAGSQLTLFLAKYMSSCGGGKALELGCGLGLTSIVLAMMGYEVTATDGNEELLTCTRTNLEANLGPEGWRVARLQW